MPSALPGPERHRRICEMLKRGEPLSVKNLGVLFGVSQMTIRRDLALLAKEGRLRRTRGWAEPVRTGEYEPHFRLRARENVVEKQAIAKTAVSMVKDGEVLIADAGTTVLEFVRLVAQKRKVTILTNWIPHLLELARYSGVNTVVLGGRLHIPELSIVGSMTGEMLAGFYADKAFLSVGGISPEKGITDYNLDEVEVKRSIVRHAREVIIVADHTKLEHVAPIRVGPLDMAQTLVTDAGITARQTEALRGAGLNVIVADVPGSDDVSGSA